MSGSRTISIRLTVAEADQFRQAFTQAGLAGQSAMQSLTNAVNASTPALHAHTQAAGLANYQIIELTESAHKFADIILSGGSAIRGLEFELPKFIGIAGGVSNALGAIGKALPLLGIAAAAAGIYELGKTAEEQQSRMALLGQQVRATRDDYTSYAKTLDDTARKLASTTPISLQDARATVNAIGINPNFSGSSADITRLSKDAEDLSVIFKTDLAGGTKVLTDGLNDASKAARDLEEKGIAGFTPDLVRAIELLQQGGKYSQAFALFLQTLEARSSGAATAGLTPLGNAMAHLDEAINKTRENGRSFAETIGKSFTDMAASVVSGLGTMIDKLADWQAAEEKASQSGGITVAKPGAPMTTMSQLPSDPLAAAAKASGLDISLLRAQSTIESGGRADAVSPAGAVGLMGVMPATFADMQKKYGFSGSITDPTANAIAGALYMREQLDAQSGNLRNAAAAYNEGPGNFAKGLMPDETRNYQASLFRAYPYGSGIVGPAVAPGAFASAPSASPPAATAVGSYGRRDLDPSDTLPPSSNMVNEDRKSAEDIAKEIEGTRAATQQSLTAELAKIEAQLQQLRDGGRAGSTDYMGLLQREQTTQAALYNNVDPQTQALREGQRSLDSQRLARRYGFTPAGDQLSANIARGQDIARTTGSPFTSDDQSQMETQFYQKANMGLTRLEATQAATAAGSERLAKAYAEGTSAVAEYTAKNEALQQINLILPKSAANYQTELERLTASYRATAQAAEDLRASQTAANDNRSTAVSQEQLRLLNSGESASQQAQDLAAFQARQANGTASPDAQDAVATAARQRTQADQALSNARGNYSELQNFASSSMDRIGDSLSRAFSSSANAAKSFGDIAKSAIQDVEQEMLKLAIINPIKNALFGGSSPTLSGVSGIAGGLLGSLLGGNNAAATNTALAGLGGMDGPATAAQVAAASGGSSILGSVGSDFSGFIKSAGSGIGSFISGLFHTGGIVGSGEGMSRPVDPSVFYGASRYHTGGIAGGEVPAVLQAGEGVFTPGQMAALSPANQGGGDTHLHLNVDARGAGPREIDILRTQIPLISMQAVQSGMTRGGAFAKAVRGG